ncbi:MAG TPA: RcpC/CpaB family pilus assembly protein [Bacillota bacterium]|nr:RcpC/CpaB family pilus assembly protein [Bacillota bacterium]
MKNRTVIGIVCIVLALAVTFGVAPLVNKLADSRCEIVRLTKNVTQGHIIAESDIEIVTVGSYNLPADIITKKESAVGMFAACDLKAGDYLLPGKVSTDADSAADVFRTLNGTKQAISITIQTFAAGLSAKLLNGDIVSLVVYTNDSGKAVIPSALTYMKVITSTTADGYDKDELTPNEDGTYELPTTLTLLVNPAQAKLLTEYENEGRIHAALVYRGDAKTAQKFIDAQDEYFKQLAEQPAEPGGDESEAPDEEPFDIVKYANDIINGKTSEVGGNG